ncbi:nucleotide kinase domain-containing protein [Sorangium sp. So ce1389]|uniref:nucleotide kinase domain-containing protein n=1 Tax=Sorangium sp. So ce1389 TaxID=3133336 RepID=UPI003F6001DF
MPPTVFAKLAPARPSIVYDTYWRFAADRQAIFFRRIEQPRGCWTEDPILARYKFTNAYRASDRVSQFLISKVMYQGDQDVQEIFFRTILFKLFNKIDTWRLLERELGTVSWRDYRFSRYDKLLNSAMGRGERIYSAAYIMPMAAGFDGERKHQTHLKLLERMMKDRLHDRLAGVSSLRAAFELLRTYPMMGDFLAFQFVIDLNYSPILNYSEMDFVVPGPGARDGIKKCFDTTGGLSEADIIRLVAERQQIEFERLGVKFQDLWGRSLQLIDCQNLFCEVDKYARVKHPDVQGVSGRSRIKQMYKPESEPIAYWYPPKWGINDKVAATLATSGYKGGDEERARPHSVGNVAAIPQAPLKPVKFPKVREEQQAMKFGDQAESYVALDEYQSFVQRSDKSGRSGREGVAFALLGLFGETGSLLSELKKKRREAEAYPAFSEAVIEEFGDVLWYLADLATHAKIPLSVVAQAVFREGREIDEVEAHSQGTFGDIQSHDTAFTGPNATGEYEKTLMRLGVFAGDVLAAFESSAAFEDSREVRSLLAKFLRGLIDAADAAQISLNQAAAENAKKVLDRWPFDRSNRAPLFDHNMDPDEQLPRQIEMLFVEKRVGNKRYVIQKFRGITIGDRLTDNMIEDDGYRFHDVFHLSYAAILGWSPVIRALLKCKRKSVPELDEVQDGARAIIIEEGISTWVFNHASKRRFFEGLEALDFSLLKSIRRLVAGFEVERCPLWQWERAILEGFLIFRQVRQQGGGIITADLNTRQISFRPAP